MSSYCANDDVLSSNGGVLIAFKDDLIDSAMFGSERALTTRISELLPLTKLAIDRQAQRDFDYHEEETVTLDGEGNSDTLFLGASLGYKPILAVTSITENDLVLEDTTYQVRGTEGEITKVCADTYTSGGAWKRGYHNITIVMTWGYETSSCSGTYTTDVPPEIIQAQAKLTAAAILAQSAGAGSGGVKSMGIGAFSVSYGDGHGYAPAINSWAEDIRAACRYYGRGIRLIGA